VARRIDDIDPHRMVLGSPLDRGAFGQDRDAALALQLARIEGAFGDLLIGAKRAALPQELIDERRLSMIDMRDDRDITDIHSVLSAPIARRNPWHPKNDAFPYHT